MLDKWFDAVSRKLDLHQEPDLDLDEARRELERLRQLVTAQIDPPFSQRDNMGSSGQNDSS